MSRRFLLASTASAAAFALATPWAQATTVSIGTLSEVPSVFSYTSSVTGSSFEDIYTFTLASTANTASASAVTIDLDSLLNIDNLSISLYDSSNALIASTDGGDSAFLLSTVLTAGDGYYYEVTGDVLGSAGGTYTFLVTSAYNNATTVPEPTSLALLATGLVAVGARRWRRPSAS